MEGEPPTDERAPTGAVFLSYASEDAEAACANRGGTMRCRHCGLVRQERTAVRGCLVPNDAASRALFTRLIRRPRRLLDPALTSALGSQIPLPN